MDDPSGILAKAREHLEALKQSGLSREALRALLEEEPEQHPQQQQQQHFAIPETSTVPNFSHREVHSPFPHPPHPTHQYRSSVSTISSTSSRDSCFSQTSVRSSISSTSGPTSDAKFWCTACDKTFKRKFDWKRHEEEFHDRSRKYPCNNCNQSFWGPNTFNQHHKSAHGCKTCPHADTVIKHMPKRKAYGCGFCAAMHRQFERHIDHVAGHFEAGSTKTDWLHSNVIYGLLHQHGIHESWKALIASKESQYNGHQPMFSWPPESTGRAQGYVENESAGQLQDLLEFFDGSRESAAEIVQLADTCVHVYLRPRSTPLSPGIDPTSPSNSHKHVSVLPKTREPRRSASTSAMARSASTSAISRASRSSRRTTPTPFDSQIATPILIPDMVVSPPAQPLVPPMNDMFQNFLSTPQPLGQMYADKALPPPPLDPVSPMDVDYQPYRLGGQYLEASDVMGDWQSFASTLVDNHFQSARGFPMTWEDLGQFESRPGN
ncbi:Uu.00g107780.m01.CDS01 [Anthostomella pinea]|uniref:Uu.00g107780.m01.CDS01 n=1 Tax=Anthostomella pinea TaxID=933095 RepID=A0AAI8VF33_9PEZI|nr:Uu.00g107780.m01.CDS01 [Anthostomella pinea]